MSTPICGLVDRLDQMLKELDVVCCDLSGDKLEHLSKQSISYVTKLRNVLKHTQVEQVAKLVQAKEWNKATVVMKQNFPFTNIGVVQEILVFIGDDLDSLTSAIKWVGRLDVALKPRAFEALYEQFKFKNYTNQLEILLLWIRIKDLPFGIEDTVRTQVIGDRERIMERVFEGVKVKDYSLSLKIHRMDESTKRDVLLNGMMSMVVSKFPVLTVENTLLLIQYSMALPRLENCCFLISCLMSALVARNLQNSEQALHVYAHANFIKNEDLGWQKVGADVQKLCTDALDKLVDKHKANMFMHYQKFFLDKDKQKIAQLHEQNRHLQSIVVEFVTWFYKIEDSKKIQSLMSAAIASPLPTVVVQRVFCQLHSEMVRFQQSNTFVSFFLFNNLKHYMATHSKFHSSMHPMIETAEVRESFEKLKAKAPAFLRLLLWPEDNENQLRLVNKFFDTPLCIQQDRIVCSSSSEDKELLICSTTMDSVKMLTCLSFGPGKLALDALTPNGSTKVPLSGNQWRVNPVDEYHVKICTDDGKFLMADGCLQEDKSKQLVCLKRENCSDMQLWKIEPAKKRMKIEPDANGKATKS